MFHTILFIFTIIPVQLLLLFNIVNSSPIIEKKFEANHLLENLVENIVCHPFICPITKGKRCPIIEKCPKGLVLLKNFCGCCQQCVPEIRKFVHSKKLCLQKN